jgi:GT2 family glycosyltransferase
MQLSIVIVNYNVKYFIEQCLLSVKKAIEGIDAEVFVIDNASVDGSVEMLREKFPWVETIANVDNRGFSKANNQAIRISKGKYVLLLNPDTVVEEDCFKKCIAFAEKQEQFGSLGVKMIDGLGEFLPESKRGLPSPKVAFSKIFGLSKLFPNSKTFGKYHLSYLSKEKDHEIDILSGAFMFMAKEALDKVGLLDETFFMYGEDIDLSYRIQLGGFKNFYYSGTTIIHYKGESTKKGSINYVYVFYKAMVIFAHKHFKDGYSKLFGFCIYSAIYFRMALSLVKRFISSVSLPLVDAILDIAILLGISSFIHKDIPQNVFITTSVILASSYLLASILFGLFKAKNFLKRWLKFIIPAFLVVFTVYSLLPENYRFGRLIIAVFAPLHLISLIVSRWLGDKLLGTRFLKTETLKKLLIIGKPDEIEEIKKRYPMSKNFGRVAEISHLNNQNIISNLDTLVASEKPQEILFSSESFTAGTIMQCMMLDLYGKPEIKIAPTGSNFVIGSNSIHSQGSVYTESDNFIGLKENKRKKRFLDISLALLCIIFFPLALFFSGFKKTLSHFSNLLSGSKTIIGVQNQVDSQLKDSLFQIATLSETEEQGFREEYQFIKDYSVERDLFFALRFIFSQV